MDKDGYALSLDFGTQSVRAIIFDKTGNAVATAKKPYKETYFSLKPGYAEQWPDYYLSEMSKATKELKEKHPDLFAEIIGLSISCFRDSAVILDKNHQVIRPSILWLDQRRANCDKGFSLITSIALFISGMRETAILNRKRTMSNWIRENEPENWAKTKYYWNLSTYFIYRLTGSGYDTGSSYAGHYPINMKKGRWQKKHELTYPVFGIDVSLLPELRDAGSLLGVISPEGAELTGLREGLPLYGGGADKSCETLGVGGITNEIGSISYGTSCSIEVPSKKYIEPETFLPAYISPVKGIYDMEVQIYRGYWMLEWFAHNFASAEINAASIEKQAVEEILNRKMMEVPPGSEGLILQPYWGPGLKRPLARGAILGFSDYHTKYHFYRSIIEGIAYALREGLEGIQHKQHHRIRKIRVSGGGAKSSAICQITADIFNLPVTRIQTYETASLGCAIIVFVAAGIYKSFEEAVRGMVHEQDVFIPDKDHARIYDRLYKHIYERIYPKIKRINYDIRKYAAQGYKE